MARVRATQGGGPDAGPQRAGDRRELCDGFEGADVLKAPTQMRQISSQLCPPSPGQLPKLLLARHEL